MTEESKNEIKEEEIVNDALESIKEEVNQEILFVAECSRKIKEEIGKVIVGQDRYIEGLIIGLLSEGHALIEGIPGIAKTLTSKLLAKTLKLDFKRIQFTPDLMPADVTGTEIFNPKTVEFEFKQGPIFSNIVLIDEINRSPAKTQSSLFEVMEEKQVTVNGSTYKMSEPFLVLATQNPIEQEGTYKLPEAQQDRFMFRIIVDYPSANEELSMLKQFKDADLNKKFESVQSVLNKKDIEKCKKAISTVSISDELLKYITDVVQVTRNSPELFLGASPRASLALMNASKTVAACNGRDFVTPDDIKYISYWVMNHRLILNTDQELEGVQLIDVLNGIIDSVEIPR